MLIIDDLQKTRKKWNVEDIQKAFGLSTHIEVVKFIEECKANGILKDCGKEKTYKTPRINKNYWSIPKENSENEDTISFINYELNHRLTKEYLLSNLGFFYENREKILRISNYFDHPGSVPLAVNERSLLVFGDEKMMLKELTLLGKLGLAIQDFNVYETPEPFFYYHNPDIVSDRILILENKDTWYTMRGLVMEGQPILDELYDTVIYGEGRKIEKCLSTIMTKQAQGIWTEGKQIFYFGDIDTTGLSILSNLIRNYPELHIQPFEKGYRFLIRHIDKAHSKDKREANVSIDEVVNLFPFLSEGEQATIVDICNTTRILPQEILNNERLRYEQE
ncbi:MAG TPA: Wadjet anti-phage system protein JetD domain-containing protein [Lachnospiraceae bacterium]|nr:Wadjet anti-phage system protein JetD domain-containing protein [Lachnospiraceae bacterium]